MTKMTQHISWRRHRNLLTIRYSLAMLLPLAYGVAATAQSTLPPPGRHISTLPPPGSIGTLPPPGSIGTLPPLPGQGSPVHSGRLTSIGSVTFYPPVPGTLPWQLLRQASRRHGLPGPRWVHHDHVLFHGATVKLPKPVVLATATDGVAAPLAAQVALTAQPSTDQALPGLVGYWAGDDNMQNAVDGRDALMHRGQATASTPDPSIVFAPGIVGSAFKFSGTNSFFKVGQVDLAPGNTPHSISLWVNVPKLPSETRSWLLLLGKGGTGSHAHHWILHADGRLQIGAWDGKGVAGWIKPGQWTHIVTTFDGTNLSLYIDGLPIQRHPARFNLQGVPLVIGKIQAPDSHSFTGAVDDITLFDRALSAPEVAAIYQAMTNAAIPVNPDLLTANETP